jgi:2'-5' RNA ligase
MANPLVLTALLDERAAGFFTAQRQKYFPPERNFLEAHLTLFHQLPPDHEAVTRLIETACFQNRPFTMQVTQVVHTGRGVAYKIESPALIQLHATLRRQWLPLLTLQDRQGLWPHVTVQNKVPPAAAKALQQQLQRSFQPFEVKAEGLVLWEYINGPWRHYKTFFFKLI